MRHGEWASRWYHSYIIIISFPPGSLARRGDRAGPRRRDNDGRANLPVQLQHHRAYPEDHAQIRRGYSDAAANCARLVVRRAARPERANAEPDADARRHHAEDRNAETHYAGDDRTDPGDQSGQRLLNRRRGRDQAFRRAGGFQFRLVCFGGHASNQIISVAHYAQISTRNPTSDSVLRNAKEIRSAAGDLRQEREHRERHRPHPRSLRRGGSPSRGR